jgi:hypothetical protein
MVTKHKDDHTKKAEVNESHDSLYSSWTEDLHGIKEAEQSGH